ncbi:hypothetical protein [Nocardia sp. NPDC057668]|uniref:hypothetical protein n=1 Tax=Nocardia sp. NPDC057668 TaxID=3346202 RepID=UPI00366C24F0
MHDSFTGTHAGSHAPQHFPAPTPVTAANGVYCRYCGATPAVHVDLRGHRAFIIFMQFLRSPGPFCRDCGLATSRRLTEQSLILGWWGIMSLFINPITMLINVAAHKRVAELPPPIPGSPRRPMDPGKPLMRRPLPILATAVVGIPIVLFALLFVVSLFSVLLGR